MSRTAALLIALFASLSPLRAAEPAPESRRAIEQVITAQVDAWNAGDLEGFMRGYLKSDNIRFLSGTNITRGWTTVLEHYQKGYPDKATMERVVQKRGPKVYVDTGQTGPSRTIVAPYSVRATPGARVSTPLLWDEVTVDLDPRAFTIRTVPARVAERGDPMTPLLSARPDPNRVLGALEKMLGARAKRP